MKIEQELIDESYRGFVRSVKEKQLTAAWK